MNKKLTKGDIILFKAEDDWLSRAIAWFTQSDVSHAAMAYSEDSIVELGARGVSVDKVDVSEGEGIYVMRLVPEMDSAPLIAAADAYLNTGVRYDYPDLFILAGMLIYKRIPQTRDVLHISNKILTACAFMLDEMIQHVLLHHTDQAMVCSEFVYNVFYDCGKDYQIQIENGCIWEGRLPEETNGTVRLFDSLTPENINADSFTSDTALQKEDNVSAVPVPENTEQLAQKLYEALCQSETLPVEADSLQNEAVTSRFSLTVSAAEKFLSKLKYFLKLVKCDLPLEAMFITPGDLAYHATNLEKRGNCSLKRI
ncbi:MAG: hypothetical protein K2N44_14065 [Lachnospiraceae bacterium]|nr:hypothetical protein [Lachnospiraceae bacterium]